MKTNKYVFAFDNEHPAGPDDALSCADLFEVIRRGRVFIEEIKASKGAQSQRATRAMVQFNDSLYGAGFVMKEFDGPEFDQGPLGLIKHEAFAGVIRNHANLLTIRMYFHTMTRILHSCDGSSGYPGFDDALRSGCLSAMLDLLEQLQSKALASGQAQISNIP